MHPSEDINDLTDLNPEDNTEQNDIFVVGIGASAGGIRALQEFFKNVPAKSGMAYVVILHLSPNYDSKLAEVLQIYAKIPVSVVNDKIAIQPDNVYVISPDHHLIMDDGLITTVQNINIEERRAPVDIFFRTLAESHRHRAVCVILSGTGANGSMGLKRVKECGGAAFVQSPQQAEYNEMPRHAIATELIDEVLLVEDIPQKIISYKQRLEQIHIPVEAIQRPEDQQQALREVFLQLRLRTGHDFSNYKRPTILRRIERRINVRNLPDLPAYAAFMQQQPEEVTSLLKDLLISVTNFYRDQKAFEVLETDVISQIFKGKTAEDQVRIWIAGCATGEEAYSIAMLCAERTLGVMDSPKVQIFATDIDDTAIDHARIGFYTLNDAADVSQERLRRFFNKEEGGYRIRKEIRETVLFAQHNFLKDPPFSHMDLISCRNVLIYLNQTAQERVMETFHFALNLSGFLFLGTSESADGAHDLYTSYNREFRIYQSRQVKKRIYPVPETLPYVRIDKGTTTKSASETQAPASMERISFGELHQQMLERYAPPSLVINEDYDIVHISENAGKYLQMAGGEPNRNLLKLIRHELRLELRSTLYQALQQQLNVTAKGLTINTGSKTEHIDIHVRPVLGEKELGKGFILIVFEPSNETTGKGNTVFASDEPMARHLEEELIRMKDQLRTSGEQYEFQAEDLKAYNEELQAMNEELRSAAEELETSKEELQSINEELITVNQELKIKVEETSFANNNLQNLINSTDIGTIFLDRSFRVVLFTPAARDIFNLIASDYGRQLSDITNKLGYADIIRDTETVLEKLQTIERELQTEDGRFFLVRLLPYRTTEDHINGVVITFINITERRLAEEQLKQSHQQTNEIIESISDSFFAVDNQWNFIYVNRHAEKIWNKNRSELIGRHLWQVFPQANDSSSFHQIQHAFNSRSALEFEAISPIINIWLNINVYPLARGGIAVYFRDITARKQAEKELIKSHTRLMQALDALNAGWIDWNWETGEIEWNENGKHIIGFAENEVATSVEGWFKRIHPDDVAHVKEHAEKAISKHTNVNIEFRVLPSNGGMRYVLISGKIKYNEQDQSVSITGLVIDITDRKMAEEQLRRSEERLRITMESAVDYAIITADINGIIIGWSRGAELIFKYTSTEAIGQSASLIFTPEDIANGVPDQEMATAREKGRANDERWHIRRDGTRFFMSGIMAPIYNSELIGYVKVARDMTGKKQTEETLLLSEERYRTALESAEMAAWDWNIPENNILWNDKHYTILGLTPDGDPLKPAFFLQFVHPDDREKLTEELRCGLEETGTYKMAEFRIVRTDNVIRWMSGYGRVIKKMAGKSTRMVGVMFDITERIEAALALQDKQIKLEIAQRAARVGIWGYDLQKHQGIATPELIELTGYPHAGETWELDILMALIHEDDRSLLLAAHKRAAEEKGNIELEFRIKLPGEDAKWLLMRGSYVAAYGNNNETLMGSLIDITERKMLEQQKEEFIGIASHELKTPVTSIKAYTDVLKDIFTQRTEQEAAGLMNKLDLQVDRLTDLIRALLDTTKIVEGQLTLQPETFDLNRLVEEKTEELQRLTTKHKISFIAGDIQPVTADTERIGQVITNLLANAIKYSPNGGDITITTSSVDNGIEVCVQDKGIGMSAEIKNKVFERFYRAKTLEINTYPGLGLGLYISAEIIKRHNGIFRVQSDEGKGSSFYFTLPV